MASMLEPAKALVDPFGAVASAVGARRWLFPLLALALAASASAAVFAQKWDPTSKVTRELAASGELTRSTEREVQEKIELAGRVRLVTGVAQGLLGMPMAVLLVSVWLAFAGWLFQSRASFSACFSAAAIAFLPIALYHLLYALAALRHPELTESQWSSLLPSSLAAIRPEAPPKLARALGAVDFFNLWSVLLLGLGFSAASGMRKTRAVALAVVLYAMYVGVFVVAMPSFAPRGGP